jgi:3D (Asp-Asp-Asp) domain-containing protein
MECTAYCNYNITASGVMPTEGVTIASDELQFGTNVTINNHVYTVQDRFGAGMRNGRYIKENCIDIYMNSYNDCIKFGRQWINCYVNL